jgi:hypothetical protein
VRKRKHIRKMQDKRRERGEKRHGCEKENDREIEK